MKRHIVCLFALGWWGCSIQHQPAQQGPTHLQPPPGANWQQRPMPSWPPTAQGQYAPIDPAELAERMPALDGALVEPAHRANDNPFVAQASVCVGDGDRAAVLSRLGAQLGAAGWQDTGLGAQLGEATPSLVQVRRDPYVLTAYAAAGRWKGCEDPARQTYLTFVAGRHQ